MQACDLVDGRGGALDPSHVVCGEVLQPGVAVFGHDEGEEVGYCVVVVGVGQDELGSPERVLEGLEGCWDVGGGELGVVVGELAEVVCDRWVS